MSDLPRRFTVQEAGDYLRIPARAIQQMAKRGELPVVRVGDCRQERRLPNGRVVPIVKARRLIFLQEDLDAWLYQHRTTGPPRRPSTRTRVGRRSGITQFLPEETRFGMKRGA